MSYAEDLLRLRKRVSDAVSQGVVGQDGKDFFEATLIQIMNDAEKNRQNCVTSAENLRRQAATMDGQANGFASVSSIIYNVINGFVTVAEKDEAERKRLEEDATKEVVEDVVVSEEQPVVAKRRPKSNARQ
jgi:hypothetical protein